MQNGYIESFNDPFRNELLNETQFLSLDRAPVVTAAWPDDSSSARFLSGLS